MGRNNGNKAAQKARPNKSKTYHWSQAPGRRVVGSDPLEDAKSTGMACSQDPANCLCYTHLKARLRLEGSY